MIEGARQLPVQHLTIRVPWHDNGWQGVFCNNPCGNTSCTILPRIATGRDDAHETEHAGASLEGLDRAQLPPCIDEHGTIMAPFAFSMMKNHPYADNAKTTHGHFAETPYTIRPYSAAAIPFRWMLREQAEGNNKYGINSRAEQLQVNYQIEREPDLTINENWSKDKKTWIQEGTNQRVMLDTFFGAAKPDQSLVFFYANGMLSNDEYRQRWERKLAAYRQQGILPLVEGRGANGTLLITEEKEGAGLDAGQIKNNIDAIQGG